MKSIVWACGICLLIFSCGERKKEVNNSEKAQFELKSSLDSLIASRFDSVGPGIALMVIYEGKQVYIGTRGMQDIEAGIPLSANSSMRMASVSKQFTAAAILKLVEEGKLSLADSVRKFFDYEVFSKMTIHQLLAHTSGLAEYYDHFAQNWDRQYYVQNSDLLEYYVKSKPAGEFPPGEGWSYSNGGYSLLASIVEVVSGEPFILYTQNAIFKPLGMNNTSFFSEAAPVEIPNQAVCYRETSEGIFRGDGHYMNGIVGEGALYTSLNDYFKWDQALRNGTFLRADLQEKAFNPALKNDGTYFQAEDDRIEKSMLSPISYGYGWFIGLNPKRPAVHHGGSWIGASTYVVRDLERPLTLVIFMNNETRQTEMIEEVSPMVERFLIQTLNR